MTQRNAILQGIRDCADDDIILISDCDEIPRSHCVVTHLDDGMVVTYLQKLYYYNFNTHAPDRVWPGTRACRVSDVRALSPHVIRNGLGQPDNIYPIYRQIGDAGWHYSYFGGIDKIYDKMTQFLHQELVTDTNTKPWEIEKRVKAGTDIWGREYEQDFVIGAADDLPYTVLRDLPKWTQHFAENWNPVFHEDWYSGAQALYVGQLARQAPEGAMVEIGCWEGRSSIIIANLINPRILHCVDHWEGNGDEDADHESSQIARERDVCTTFMNNIGRCTAQNVHMYHADWHRWIGRWDEPIAFLHLDASHDRASVRDCLAAIKPFLVEGAILCGDDAYDKRVIAGVRDVFPDAEVLGERLWKVVHEIL